MAANVQQIWKKYSSKKGAAGMPPTEGDKKLRAKHVSESVPYNVGHAVEHMNSISKQLTKLKLSDGPLAKVLANKAVKQVHAAENKLAKFGDK
jgi:hypothetical protein